MEIGTNIGYLISIFNRYTEKYIEIKHWKICIPKRTKDDTDGRHESGTEICEIHKASTVHGTPTKKGSLMLTSNREHMPRRSH